jgi:hypothetical protein
MSYRLLAIVLGCALAASLPVQAGLIGFYPFEGNILDSSGLGNHGTFGPTAPSLTASGYEGAAYQFGLGGANTYLTVPININPSAMPALTMGAWVNAAIADSVIRGIVSHDDGGFDRSLGVDTRGTCASLPCWSAFRQGTVLSSNITVQTGQWVFLAVRYDQVGKTVTLNVDGAQFQQTNQTLGSSARTITTIGRNPGYDSPFVGAIDNVFFFNEVLSDSQVNAIRVGGANAILSTAAVPEPGTVVLFGIGLAALMAFRRRCS